jgi:hypothetical protein
MVARARKKDELFKDYKESLKNEGYMLKYWLRGVVTWGKNNGSNKGWRNKLKKKLKKENNK